MQNIFNLEKPDGYTPLIGSLIAQLNLVKYVITRKVYCLSIAELDTYVPNYPNSIGVLLKHMAAVEYQYTNIIFKNRDLNKNERKSWRGALPGELALKIIKDRPILYYLETWDDVRNKTLSQLKLVDDAWLYNFPRGSLSNYGNNYYCLFHTLEDQVCHYGQIRSMLPIIRDKNEI